MSKYFFVATCILILTIATQLLISCSDNDVDEKGRVQTKASFAKHFNEKISGRDEDLFKVKCGIQYDGEVVTPITFEMPYSRSMQSEAKEVGETGKISVFVGWNQIDGQEFQVYFQGKEENPSAIATASNWNSISLQLKFDESKELTISCVSANN
ncbi:MAG: hypothetical protein A2504_12890 [Bdellovibrionales bacterium RIFOXYD12_FULL_39_22]|nr:MAG: hypothetical protein A2385_11975 [Bdellovibrionales bacterium RIFOXYB1_FULL_39_21]OFZ48942.1 MAG: hypothetical protein A2404_14185 [Bdellovibrionales bacterium RIFOXYC1_FULL_39_130]OFZ69898.1 MAG: hypothetical protein A2451_01260 [Bdellovibrionales bacterium RIFOXYC2_FULL_39_8]OFZ77636.1 MAG: hypothetical protein A2560_04735 [Bdellovibrionales bacterium RIFOXYD1_FULL_39_84]OFZ96090.1 MAG: hypothetical protein A2504_12890 [Bdellovibrionales bacterium RIFOXYD12_FULL_39_22]HLE11629.1 hypo